MLVFHSCGIVFPRLSFEYFPPRKSCDIVRMTDYDFCSDSIDKLNYKNEF